MTIAFQNVYQTLIMTIKGVTSDNAYGFTEQYPLKGSKTEAELRVLAADLADLRCRLIPNDHEVSRIRCTEIGTKFKTLQCLTAAVQGAYPGTATLTAIGSATNTTLGMTTGNTSLNTTFKELSINVLKIDDADTTARFLTQGEGFTKATRHFHAVPDFFVNDWKSQGVPSGVSFQGGTEYVSGAIPVADVNYWNNWRGLFDFMIANCALVRKPGVGGIGAAPDGQKWALCPINNIIFEDIGDAKVGRPFDAPRGRLLHRS
jgi:hypothetical protein